MKKTNCIYCNIEDIKFEDYIVVKSDNTNICLICEKDYMNDDDKYYSKCCNKISCFECINEWFNKLLKNDCLFCNTNDIFFDDFKNEKQHEEMRLNQNAGVKYTKKTKLDFLKYFIETKIYGNCKIIICSNYIRIFNDIVKLLNSYKIEYIELDDGNIEAINNSLKKYTYGNIKVLLLNSNLFGCGLNLQCTTDIIFLHKTEETLEKQIIGRAQRLGRKNKLNIWYLMHKNESSVYNI